MPSVSANRAEPPLILAIDVGTTSVRAMLFDRKARDIRGTAISAETPLTYAADLQTKKGNYRIVVNVRDLATGKMGTARANVRVE